ncbi:MAG: NAD(P)H-binding protein, partial [Clostridiales bacterium]|nr:NAD(P)H-binding protein [Clostridiales bacterium]
MNRVLITGATGNVGKEVIGSLLKIGQSHSVVAGVQDVEESKMYFTDMDVQLQHFDFEDNATFRPAFDNCDILFLLRPPQISDVKRYFVPLIEAAKQTRIKHIVFLSVQGAENSKFIPHHKIERLIVES